MKTTGVMLYSGHASAWFIPKNQAETQREWERQEKKSPSSGIWQMVVDWLLQPCQKSDVQLRMLCVFVCVCVCVCVRGEIGLQISNEHTANMKRLSICFHLHCLFNSIHNTTCLLVFLSENTHAGIA